MIYCHLNDRVTLPMGKSLTVGEAAQLYPADERVKNALLPCPEARGVWKLKAVRVAQAVTQATGDAAMMLGPSVCYVHRTDQAGEKRSKPVLAALAFVLLVIGSALALCWFHSDVAMPDAQQELFRLITGHRAENPAYITIPYAIGVGLGVAFFYSLIGRRTISPMEMKLKKYRTDNEQAEGKEVPPCG